MTMRRFIGKAILPIAAALLTLALFYPLCVEQGICDYWKLWLLAGIPFGVHKMYFWLIPKGFDLGGTVGMFVFNLLIGGVIGGLVLVWRLFIAAVTLIIGAGYGIRWGVRKVKKRE